MRSPKRKPVENEESKPKSAASVAAEKAAQKKAAKKAKPQRPSAIKEYPMPSKKSSTDAEKTETVQQRVGNSSAQSTVLTNSPTSNLTESAPSMAAKRAAQREAGQQSYANQSSAESAIDPGQDTKVTTISKEPEKSRSQKKNSAQPASLSRDLPVRNKPATNQKTAPKVQPTHHATNPPPKWTCSTCQRPMQETQKQDHLAGKPHLAHLKEAQAAESRTSETPTVVRSTPQEQGHLAGKHHLPHLKGAQDTGSGNPDKPSIATSTPQKAKGKSNKGKNQQRKPQATGGSNHRARPEKTVKSAPYQLGMPYPPDVIFSGFGGARGSYRSYSSSGMGWGLGDEDYSVCDKDCGWCGHCMDEVYF